MFNSIADFNYKKIINRVDWMLLLFLMLFLNVKIGIKIPAIIIIYLLRFNFKFGLSFKNSRLPLFYLLIMFIPFINLLINKGYSNADYLIVFFTGIGFWLLSLLAIHQVKLSVENNDTEIIHRTILVFFILNAVASFINIGVIMWVTHTLNPYRYQGESQKYFIGTGDFIKGLTFDYSPTNAVLNAIGVIYFLVRKNAAMTLVCMAVLLLTGSNFFNIALIVTLAFLFIFRSTKNQKSLIVICLMLLVVFMGKVSPQNDVYFAKTLHNFFIPPSPQPEQPVVATRCSNIPTTEDARRNIALRYMDSARRSHIIVTKQAAPLIKMPRTGQGRIFIDTPDINAPQYQSSTDTSAEQRLLISFIGNHRSNLPLSAQKAIKPGLSGKVISAIQTLLFLKQHPAKIITGNGIGNFSSKLAFRATGLGFAGGFPSKHTYVSADFLTNHLDVYLDFFSRSAGLRSFANNPNFVYDQLLGEYGLAGLLVFAIFYLGFFARHAKTLTYGLPLLLLLMMIFFTDYWFEQLSVVVFFELLLLLNIKETTKPSIVYGS